MATVLNNPAYVALMKARIRMAFGPDQALSRRVFAATMRENNFIEEMELRNNILLFNHRYVIDMTRTPAGRADFDTAITKLFS